jgi:hypothetical protein
MMNSLQRALTAITLAIAVPTFLVGCASTETAAPTKISASSAPASLYTSAAPLDLRLSNWPYPYPVKEFKTSLQGQAASMMYMDVPAIGKQKGVVLLFHGKNFSSDYWAPTIAGLTQAGYRVIAPVIFLAW